MKYENEQKETKDNGFTLIEVLVAMTLMAVGLVTLIELFSGSLSLALYSRIYTTATFLANQKMGEALLSKETPSLSGSFEIPYDDFNYNVEITTQELSVGSTEDSFFSEEKLTPNPGLKKIKVTISWEEGHRERKFNLETMQAMVIKHESKD